MLNTSKKHKVKRVKNTRKAIWVVGLFIGLALIILSVVGLLIPEERIPKERIPEELELPENWRVEVITPELEELFSAFDADQDGALSWEEGMAFYEGVKQNIAYRFDDEYDSDGLERLQAGTITREQLGDGREGDEYWQRPIETYNEVFGDCDDQAILHLAFYDYWGIGAYLAVVDVDGDGVVDHAICIV